MTTSSTACWMCGMGGLGSRWALGQCPLSENLLCYDQSHDSGHQKQALICEAALRARQVQHLTQEPALLEQVQLTEMEIRQLCLTAKEIFMGQPNLLELEAPIKICGGLFTYDMLWSPKLAGTKYGLAARQSSSVMSSTANVMYSADTSPLQATFMGSIRTC